MNYEEKYKEALKVIESLHSVVKYQSSSDALFASQTIEKAFPELRESEDEKIRKDIVEYLKSQGASKRWDFNTWIAWLEKQKGNKNDYDPYKATVESIAEMCKRYSTSTDLHDFYDNVKVKCKDAMEYDKTWIEKQGEQKYAWSEEDEEMIDFMIEFIESLCWRKDLTKRKDEVLSWLKSLKPNWKPAENQMSMLLAVIHDGNNANSESCHIVLQSLYNDLKKLRLC